MAGHYWRKGEGSTWWNSAPPASDAADLYFGVHPATRAGGRNERTKLDTVAAINCLFADFDAKDFGGNKAAALAHILALPVQPSVIIDSGGGLHAYWLLDTPYLLDSTEARERARQLQHRWVAFVGSDKGAQHLTQVLRVPGSRNTKYSPARPVQFVRAELGTLYQLGTLDSLMPAVQPEPAPVITSITPTPAPGGRRSAREAIAAFNAENPIDSLITRYGGTVTREGFTCNCGTSHEHSNQGAITNQGRAIFFSPRCGWAPGRTDRNGRPIADAFDLYTQVEHHGDKAAALKAINPWQRTDAERRADDAERKRVARAEAATTTLQAVYDRAAEDVDLPRCEREVLKAMLQIAGDRAWCRPSKARLAQMTGYSEGAVKRALMRLEDRGYFVSTGDGGRSSDTAIRTFLRGSSSEQTGGRSYVDHHDPRIKNKASEGGRCEPSDLDDDGWAALLASSPPALDEYPDLAALAACEVAGLCEVPGELLPEAGQLDTTPAEQAAPPSPAPAPEPACAARVAEAVVIADGATFTPQPDPAPDAPYTGTSKATASTEAEYAALYRLYQEHMQRDRPAADVPPAPDADGPMVKGPPRAAHLRTAYYALKGRARKATSRKQRMYLDGQARALEEWYTPAELAQHRAPPLARSTPAADVQADQAAYQGALWGS